MSHSRTRPTRRASWLVALLAMLAVPAQLFAQESSPLFAQQSSPLFAAQTSPAPTPVRQASQASRPLAPLYVSFAVLQALDVHSTTRALRSGAVEGNPLMRSVARQPAGLIALKAGGAASTIWLSHKLSKRSRTGAFVLMTAMNSAYAMVVAHNYRAR